jgi:hypothetical protein
LAAGFGLRRLFARLGAQARTVSSALIVLSGVLVLALRNGLPLAPTAVGENAAESTAACPLHPH